MMISTHHLNTRDIAPRGEVRKDGPCRCCHQKIHSLIHAAQKKRIKSYVPGRGQPAEVKACVTITGYHTVESFMKNRMRAMALEDVRFNNMGQHMVGAFLLGQHTAQGITSWLSPLLFLKSHKRHHGNPTFNDHI